MLRRLLRASCYTSNTIRYRVEWRRLEEAFRRVGPVGSILDGGAGSGEFVRLALKAGYVASAVAMEPAPRNFLLLKRNLGNDRRVRLVQGGLLDVPLPDASMDMVMTTQVLEHIDDHTRAASELVRVLKPGGHAIVTVPHPPEPAPNPEHVREGYTERELLALFAPFGMSLLHTDYFLTRKTLRRMAIADTLPFHGAVVPVAFVDAEAGVVASERRAQLPYGILGLFRKA
jgi:SAM-dependent methyltransferase